MTDVEALPIPLSQSSLVKMEERKRSNPYDQNESAPPLKKQATSANGASKSHPDADMPYKDDLEVSLFASLEQTPAIVSAFRIRSNRLMFAIVEVSKRRHIPPNARV